jgi:hypothetical protein
MTYGSYSYGPFVIIAHRTSTINHERADWQATAGPPAQRPKCTQLQALHPPKNGHFQPSNWVKNTPKVLPLFGREGRKGNFFLAPGRPFGPWWGPTIPAQNMPNFWVKSSDCRLGVCIWPALARLRGQTMQQKHSSWCRVGPHAGVRLAGCNNKKERVVHRGPACSLSRVQLDSTFRSN